MSCNTETYAAGEIVKDPGTDRLVTLNLYRDCINFRKSNEPYDLLEFMRPPSGNGYAYECTSAGTTGERMPILPTTVGDACRDGSVEWTCRVAGLNAVLPIVGPSAVPSPIGTLTIVNVAVVEGWKIVATYVGGTLGQDYDAVFSFTMGGRPVTVRQRIHVRKQ